MTPSLLAPTRRWPFARLGLLTLAEAGLFSASAVLLRNLLDAAVASAGWAVPAGVLVGVAVVSFAAGWLRSVFAEDLGMAYANEMRLMLAEHAASAAGNRRLGAMAVRMTGDLNPMREWVAVGLSESAAGVAALVSAIVALAIAGGSYGLAAAVGCVVAAAGAYGLLRPGLVSAIRTLRTSRGRVASVAGDIVLGASAISRFDAFSRERKRLERRAARLRTDAVRRRKWASALDAPAVLAAPVVLIVLVLLQGRGAAMSSADWAMALFGASFLGLGLRSLSRAIDSQAAFSVAAQRMQRLGKAEHVSGVAAREAPVLESAADFLMRPPGRAAIPVQSGEVVLVCAEEGGAALAAVEAGGAPSSFSFLGRKSLAQLSRRELGRRVALVSPGIPLVRASLRRNLSLRRVRTTDDEMRDALRIVGLPVARWPLSQPIDPALRRPDELSQAMLRLARAITHRPRVILIAEPILLYSPDAPALLKRVAAATGAAIVAASYAQPTAGTRQVMLDPVAEEA